MDCFYNIITFITLIKTKGIHYVSSVMRGNTNEVKRIYPNKKMNLIEHVKHLTDDPSYIIDNLYLGNSYNSSNIYTLKKFGIEKIVNATKEIPCSFPDEIEYFQIPIRDTRDNFIDKYLESSYQFIEKNKKHNILVHCYMGSSRSAIIIIYYLIHKHKMTLQEALDFLKKKRSIININKNFISDIEKRVSSIQMKKI